MRDHSTRSVGTLGEVAASMRSLFALITLPLLISSAAAERTGKPGNDHGGPLSKVSSGIRGASSGSGEPSTGSSSYTGRLADQEMRGCYDHHGRFHERDHRHFGAVECRAAVMYSGRIVRRSRPVTATDSTSRFGFYAGAQKVADSDASASIELTVTEERFGLRGMFTRYFERQTAGVLTMSMPSLVGAIRIDDMGATAVYLEGGVVHARTNNDPMGDSKLTGPVAGVRVEHALSNDISLTGDVQQMWFPDKVLATGGRVGVRYRFMQASVRVLDFNVGPPLYGPEVGVRF